uniref:Uncharacterized protein n=1 Tax=Ixodes ricinus TaxID=34613 RepID=A0A6B0U8J3_IXORI
MPISLLPLPVFWRFSETRAQAHFGCVVPRNLWHVDVSECVRLVLAILRQRVVAVLLVSGLRGVTRAFDWAKTAIRLPRVVRVL